MYSFFLLKNVLFAQSDKCCELRKTKCQPMRSEVMWWCQISDSISQNIPSHTFPLNAVIPIQMHLFIFSIEKMYYLHKATSAVSCVKPNASQWEASCDDIGFPTVYRRIYHRKFFSLSNQTARLGGSVGYAFDWRPGGRKFNPRRGWQHSFVEIDDEIFSTVILSIPLIQEGQMSVSGERMFTILVNRLED